MWTCIRYWWGVGRHITRGSEYKIISEYQPLLSDLSVQLPEFEIGETGTARINYAEEMVLWTTQFTHVYLGRAINNDCDVGSKKARDIPAHTAQSRSTWLDLTAKAIMIKAISWWDIHITLHRRTRCNPMRRIINPPVAGSRRSRSCCNFISGRMIGCPGNSLTCDTRCSVSPAGSIPRSAFKTLHECSAMDKLCKLPHVGSFLPAGENIGTARTSGQTNHYRWTNQCADHGLISEKVLPGEAQTRCIFE